MPWVSAEVTDGGWLKPVQVKEDLGICCLSSECCDVITPRPGAGVLDPFPTPKLGRGGYVAVSFQWILLPRLGQCCIYQRLLPARSCWERSTSFEKFGNGAGLMFLGGFEASQRPCRLLRWLDVDGGPPCRSSGLQVCLRQSVVSRLVAAVSIAAAILSPR